MTTFTGSIPTIASGDTTTVPTNLATYRDALKAASEAWTSYTPAWTASVNPAIGNGTQVWKYLRVNKLVIGRIQITMGSTTTFGTGNWVFGLPVAAHADYTANMSANGKGMALDASVPAFNQLAAIWQTSTTIAVLTSANTSLSSTVPWTWTTSDKFSLDFEYEAA